MIGRNRASEPRPGGIQPPHSTGLYFRTVPEAGRNVNSRNSEGPLLPGIRRFSYPCPVISHRFPLCLSAIALILLVLSPPCQAQAPNSPVGNHLVGTVLGTPSTTSIGDSRLAAMFDAVSDAAFLPGGDLLVAEFRQNRVLRVSSDGIVRVFAGNGQTGISGDGGAATEAEIPKPVRLAVDAAGNVYIGHLSNDGTGGRIRKVTPSGTLSTIAGNGEVGCPEIGALAVESPLAYVGAMTADAESLYFFADTCRAVYRIKSDGSIDYLIASPPLNPNGTRNFSQSTSAIPAVELSPGTVRDLAMDEAGNVLVAADATGRILYRITPAGVALHVAGSLNAQSTLREGPAVDVYFSRLESIAVLPNGGIAVAQNASTATASLRQEVGVVSLSGEYSILVTGDGAGGNPTTHHPGGNLVPAEICVSPDGAIYVSDLRSSAIVRVNQDGTTTPYLSRLPPAAQIVPNGTQPVWQVSAMSNLSTDAANNLYFSAEQRIYRLSPEGALTHIAGTGQLSTSPDGTPPLETAVGQIARLESDSAGNQFWPSAVNGQSVVRRLNSAGEISTVLGGGSDPSSYEGKLATSLSIEFPGFWDVAANGEIYFLERALFSDTESDRIWKVGLDGRVTRVAGKLSGGYSGVLDGIVAREAGLKSIIRFAVSPSGIVFFATNGLPNFGIYQIDSEGTIRLVSLQSNSTGKASDGDPTIGAPSVPGFAFRPIADDRLLLAAGSPRALAEYIVGGSVRVWRDSSQGIAAHDGGFVKDESYVDFANIVQLADGGIAWTEFFSGLFRVRRSFPIPDGCTYTPSATEIPVSGGNVLTQVTLTTGANCPWTVGASASWLEILSPRFGKGTVTINLRALANPSPSERTAVLLIAGKELLVHQAPSTLPNIFVVSPSAANVPATGGSVEVTISASPGLPWQVALPGIPIAIDGPAAGTGSAMFVLTLEELPANVNERTAIVTVNDKTVTLRQIAQAAPVPITITSSPTGSKATIDLVERTLPYVAQWVPGSYHYLQAAAFTKVSDSTLIQFRSFGTGSTSEEQVYIAPSSPATLVAQYRRLHLLRAWPLVQSLPSTFSPIFNFRGVAVPAELQPISPEVGAEAMWFPEGSTVKIFAPEETGVRFVNFTGGLSTTENPSTVLMNAPATITANYTTDLTQQQPLLVGGAPMWWFTGNSRSASAAQVTVVPASPDAQPELRTFVAYHAAIEAPDWITLRPSNPIAPLSLEVGVDAAKAEAALASPLGAATVYLQSPGMRTASFPVAAIVRDTPPISWPWISVITDAGGFRQSVNDLNTHTLSVAPGMILTVFGINFGTQSQDAIAVPLPTTLGGVSVEAQQGGSGPWIPMPLFFVSPTQINFQVSPSLFAGNEAATLVSFRVRIGPSNASDPYHARLRVRSVSLFSADVSGGGAPAGFYVRVLSNQTQQRGDLFTCSNGTCAVPAIAFGGAGNDLFLELYGTGFRDAGFPGKIRAYIGGREAEVTFAGPHPVFVGLDQVNVKVPRDIPRGASLDLYIWVQNEDNPWMASNRLTLRFE